MVHPVGSYCTNSFIEESGLLGSNIASFDATSTHKTLYTSTEKLLKP